jgi:hypothetical protein
VLRDGQVGTLICSRHYNVAAYLTRDMPARFGECLNGFFAGNVGETCHTIVRGKWSDGYDDGSAVGTHRLNGFLILGP